MKKMLLSVWLLFSCSFLGFGQVDTLAVKNEIDSLLTSSKSFLVNGALDQALETNSIAEKLAIEKLGTESASYGKAISFRGTIYYYSGNYEQAEAWWLKSKSLREKVTGKYNKDYANNLNNLAVLYVLLNQNEKAAPLHEEAKNIREKLFGKESQDYAQSLSNLSILYLHMRKYAEAEQLLLEAKELEEKALRKDMPKYPEVLGHLSELYGHQGKLALAMQYGQEAQTIWERIVGKEDVRFAKSTALLAGNYMELSEFEKAEQLFLEAKPVLDKLLKKEDPAYLGHIGNLAALYVEVGKYEQAEQLLLELKAIEEAAYGKEFYNYSNTINNLAGLYSYLGNREKAEALYIEAKELQENLKRMDGPDYANALHNLAFCYMENNRLDAADSLFQIAKDIWGRTLGENDPNYALVLDKLGILNASRAKYERAEQYFLESKEARARALGTNHRRYAESLHNLANLYYDLGQWERASNFYLEAKTVWEHSLGKQHIDYVKNLSSFAKLNWENSQHEIAKQILLEAGSLEKLLLANATQHLSARELSNYIHTFSKSLNLYNSFAQVSKAYAGPSYDNVLFYKGFLLNASTRINSVSIKNAPFSDRLNEYKSCRRRLAKAYAIPIEERKDVAELEEKANTLEKELARSVAGFGDAIRQVSWQEVQAALKPNEAAIEIVRYDYYTPKPTDSVMYTAMILRPGMESPEFVHLFEEKQLQAILAPLAVQGRDGLNELYAGQAGQSLYQLLWKPLEPSLQGINAVYVSPAGLLHRLNLGAIHTTGTTAETIGKRYELNVVGSTRQLVVGSALQSPSAVVDAVVFGGIQYELDTTAIKPARPEESNTSNRGLYFSQTDSTLRGDTWRYLKYSEKEVLNIQSQLQKAGFQVDVYKGLAGTEESFKQIGKDRPAPKILHLSTHGFFFPDVKNQPKTLRFGLEVPVFKVSDNPMIRAGLILAGGNYAWKYGKPFGDREDGILTAYEISQMDLRNTDLVVLSACETGLGQIEGNEGVYGLQRAFKIAGAKHLVMSLWQVPDFHTQELMTAFYNNMLTKKMPTRAALLAAQEEMRLKRYEPFFWAGFVLVE